MEYATFVDLMDDDEFVDIGRTTCEVLETETVDAFYSAGDEMQSRLKNKVLLVGSVTFLCPEHEEMVAEWHDR